MSIDRNTANTNTNTALGNIQTNADTIFIANVDSQIATAVSLGQYQVTAITSPNVNLTTVYNYYSNLGYAISFPDFANQNAGALPSVINQPQNFFGYNWTAFWLNAITLFNITNPARMTISWL